MSPDGPRIRAIDAASDSEVALVAERMAATLDEVLGPDRAEQRYSQAWLENRVRQHLDPQELTGAVFVAESSTIVGHTIVRLDETAEGAPCGLFSTIYVVPGHRRQGVAEVLLERGEAWMREHAMKTALTYTDKDNTKLHALFGRRGYQKTPMPDDFVALSKSL